MTFEEILKMQMTVELDLITITKAIEICRANPKLWHYVQTEVGKP